MVKKSYPWAESARNSGRCLPACRMHHTGTRDVISCFEIARRSRSASGFWVTSSGGSWSSGRRRNGCLDLTYGLVPFLLECFKLLACCGLQASICMTCSWLPRIIEVSVKSAFLKDMLVFREIRKELIDK